MQMFLILKLSFNADILAFFWLDNFFGYLIKKLGNFFQSSGHPAHAQVLNFSENYCQ
jgi:hypothetical protein